MKERIKGISKSDACKRKSSNSGSTLVVVLTVVAFLSILAVVVTSAATTNYKMKIINKQSQKAFYTSENALDEIYAALGKISIETFDEAYNEELASVVKSFDVGTGSVSLTMPNLDINRELRKNYTYKLLDTLKLLDESKDKNAYTGNDFQLVSYDVNMNKPVIDNFVKTLNSYLEGMGETDENKVGLRVVSIDTIKITTENTKITKNGSTTPLDLKQYTLTFTNCRVEYLNERAYYSNITFDGKLAMPDIYLDFSTETTKELTTFADYALVGNTGISIGRKNGSEEIKGNLILNGNAYAGKGAAESGGVLVTKGSAINVASGITLVSGGDITVNDGTLTTNNSKLWCESLVTVGDAGSSVNISGSDSSTYVKDDLQVEGDFSTVKLEGSYLGYSYQGLNTAEGNHNNSSAIIVNGEKSAVNMSALKELVLGGRAYIDYVGFSPDKAYTTGESVSLMGTQEMYLVPSYMMTRETTVDGNTVVTDVSNPIVGDTTGVKVNITDKNFFGWDYLDSQLYSAKEVKVGGKTVTYYYFRFKGGNGDKAVSDYVKALLDDNAYKEITDSVTASTETERKQTISDYDKCRAYIRGVIMANLSAQSSDLISTVSGTVYTNGQMINAEFKDGKNNLALSGTNNSYIVDGNAVSTDGFILESMDLSNRYDLLSMILAMPEFLNGDGTRNYLYKLGNSVVINNESVNISGYDKNNVFENIISMDDLNKLVATEAHSEVINIPNYGSGVVSYITNGKTTIISQEQNNYDYGIIVTTGDVIVKKNFTGTIIARGTIYIESNVTVKSDRDLVNELLSRDSVLQDILNTSGSTVGAEVSVADMTYKDFVDFINWRKTENVTEESHEQESE